MSKREIVFDTETALSIPGLNQPPLACLTWAERQGAEIKTHIVHGKQATQQYRQWLNDPDVILIGAQTRYDTGGLVNTDTSLLPDTFKAYEQGRFRDVLLREQLLDLSHGAMVEGGGYGLAGLAKKHFDKEMEKDEWRTKYGKLINVPLHDWPEGAVKYAVDDAYWTLRVYEHQKSLRPNGIVDEIPQTNVSFVHQLMGNWGMRTDEERVVATKEKCMKRHQETKALLRKYGILRYDGTQDMANTKRLIKMSSRNLKYTEKGGISTSAEALERCDHPGLNVLAEYKEIQKVLTTFIPVVEQGIEVPVNPYFNTLVRNGRSSCARPNLQQVPRSGGIRECFVPRPGKVFIDADYDSLEVRTFAQVLHDFGMGDTFLHRYNQNPDFDPHTRLAAQLMHISEEHALQLKSAGDKRFKEFRQLSKPVNFGLPGGMGPHSFVDFAKASYGVVVTLEESKNLKKFWLQSIPEAAAYFKWVASQTRNDRKATIEQLRSGRVRGGCGYTDLANTMWSGLAADGVKWATWQVARACYIESNSPLYGARPVSVIHDELILEADEGREHEVGMELSRLMQESMAAYTPNIPSRASAQAMRRWYKSAEPTYNEQGRLIPWEPQKEAA